MLVSKWGVPQARLARTDLLVLLFFSFFLPLHKQMHSHMGGAWDCAYDLRQVYEEHKDVYSKDLLSFIGIAGKLFWASMAGIASHRVRDRGIGVRGWGSLSHWGYLHANP